MEFSKALVFYSSHWLFLGVKSIDNGFYVFNESILKTQNRIIVDGERSQNQKLSNIPRFLYLLRDKVMRFLNIFSRVASC